MVKWCRVRVPAAAHQGDGFVVMGVVNVAQHHQGYRSPHFPGNKKGISLVIRRAFSAREEGKDREGIGLL